MTFANSLDPDQALQNIEPDLDPNHNNLVFVKKEKNIHFENKNQQTVKTLIFWSLSYFPQQMSTYFLQSSCYFIKSILLKSYL